MGLGAIGWRRTFGCSGWGSTGRQVTWDADLRWSGEDWSYHSFRGTLWTDVNTSERPQYLKKTYRVLVTPARRAMVTFAPPGAKRDKTRSPGFYEGVYEYLTDPGHCRGVINNAGPFLPNSHGATDPFIGDVS